MLWDEALPNAASATSRSTRADIEDKETMLSEFSGGACDSEITKVGCTSRAKWLINPVDHFLWNPFPVMVGESSDSSIL